MEDSMGKTYVTWSDVTRWIDEVAKKYRKQNVTGVYGFPRGGLVPAVMLSHRLHIPMLASPINGCIIVDDICDSGETLFHYCKNSSSNEEVTYHIVTMFYRPNELNVEPESWFKMKEEGNWVIFPWEA